MTDDGGYTLTPELLYAGFTNLELRLRAGFIACCGHTESGKKQNNRRLELRAEYYF